MIDKEDLFKQGLWPKCFNPLCNKPAYKNDSIRSFCCPSCRAKFNTPQRNAGLKKFLQDNPGWRSIVSNAYWQKPENQEKQRMWKLKQHQDHPEIIEKMKRTHLFQAATIEYAIKWSRFAALGRQRQIARKKKDPYESKKGILGSSRLIYCRNEYDKIVFQKLDENPLVDRWIFLDFAILYWDISERDKPHHFVIDLNVFMKDGTRKIISIAPNGWIQSYQRVKLLQLIEKYCIENKCIFEVWTKEQIIN